MVTNRYSSTLEKVACGAFSDISFVSAGKKRGFCQLRSRGKRTSEGFLGQLEKLACGRFCALPSLDGTLRADLRSSKRAPARLSDISSVAAGKRRDFCPGRVAGYVVVLHASQ